MGHTCQALSPICCASVKRTFVGACTIRRYVTRGNFVISFVSNKCASIFPEVNASGEIP